MTFDEQVQEIYDLLKKSPKYEQDLFGMSTKEGLVVYHHSIGQYIRNHFKLWEKEWEPEIRNKNGETIVVKGKAFRINGDMECDCSPNHPDAISSRIIEAVWERFQEEYK